MHLGAVLCNLTTILHGVWQYVNHSSPHISDSMRNPWLNCPRTYSLVQLPPPEDYPLNSVAAQISRYSCFNQTYKLARYSTPHCHVETLNNAMNSISEHISRTDKVALAKQKEKRRNRVVFIGDSLMGQIYIAAQCSLEEHHIPPQHFLNLSYYGDFFLRPDIPCDPKCIGNPTMWNVSAEKVIFPPCFACPKGVLRPFDTFIHDPIASWVENIPNDTFAVVLSSGAWYNIYKGLVDPVRTFEDTLIKLKPFLQHIVQQRQIEVIWVGLPPMSVGDVEALGKNYGWDSFPVKDDLVKKHYSDLGVHFIDTNRLLGSRKVDDPRVKSDPLHWW